MSKRVEGTLSKLSKLINAEITPEHFETYAREVSAIGNDRGAAILMTVQVEDVLQFMLFHRLGLATDRFEEVFDQQGPLSTFDAKVKLAYAMGILTDDTRFIFDVVRKIRNTFAHATIPISFVTPEIAAACKVFDLPKALPPVAFPADGSTPDYSEPRNKFRRTCEILIHNLFTISGFYSYDGKTYDRSF